MSISTLLQSLVSQYIVFDISQKAECEHLAWYVKCYASMIAAFHAIPIPLPERDDYTTKELWGNVMQSARHRCRHQTSAVQQEYCKYLLAYHPLVWRSPL